MSLSGPIRTVVVEDAVVQQRHLVRLLERDRFCEVVATADSVETAVEVVARTQPDVVTMDLELPGGNNGSSGGAEATSRIMAAKSVPILIVSAYAAKIDDVLAVEALAAGAVDIFAKPEVWTDADADALRRRVGVLSRLTMTTRRRVTAPVIVRRRPGGVPVVGLVASTGGPPALRAVVSDLAGLPAPILAVQHILADFAESFATWLESATGVPVVVAEDGARLRPGTVHVAPGGMHIRLGPDRAADVGPEPADVLTRPSGDELLRSIAEHAGPAGVGAVLTGMGEDGARGLKALQEAGGETFVQSGETAVVDGMTRAARELDTSARVLPLEALGAAIGAKVRGSRG